MSSRFPRFYKLYKDCEDPILFNTGRLVVFSTGFILTRRLCQLGVDLVEAARLRKAPNQVGFNKAENV